MNPEFEDGDGLGSGVGAGDENSSGMGCREWSHGGAGGWDHNGNGSGLGAGYDNASGRGFGPGSNSSRRNVLVGAHLFYVGDLPDVVYY